MARLSLILMICLSQLALVQHAKGLQPDQVKYSPVPPLKQTPQQTAKSPTAQLTEIPGLSPDKRYRSATEKKYKSNEELETERSNIWNSSSMKEARKAIVEFCKYSAQVSDAERDQFLKDLSQLSPEEMADWLKRYEAKKRQASHSRTVDDTSRQLRVSDSLRRQEVQRNVATHIAELQRESFVMQRIEQQQRMQLTVKPFTYLGDTRTISSPSYNPFELVFDPASPTGARRQMAAAASLPGDLPDGDPANFAEPPEVVDP